MNSKYDLKAIVESLNHYIDSHLMEVRLSIGALGLIGLGISLRSIRFATKFYDNKKIPKSFIKKNIRLRGIVKSVAIDGTVSVDHIPIISMPWHRNQNNERLLTVGLAAINPNISGVYWLKLNVENKMIWFEVIDRNESQINSIVSENKKIVFNKSLNAILVEKGLAVVKPYDQSLGSIKAYKNLYKTLIASETKAKRNRSGVWFTPSKWDGIRDQMNRFFGSLRNVKNLF